MITKHRSFKFIIAAFATISMVAASSAPALAAKSASLPSPLGNDVSWPQCSKPLPNGQAFGIVGINGGTAIKDNPCLVDQMKWALNSNGSVAAQKKLQFYANTANPGDQHVASWPQNNTDPSGNLAPNPFTTCDGSDSDSCAWQYGWNRAVEDVQTRFIPAARTLGIDSNPASYPWWLDVETVNSWESQSSAALARNAHDLEGMQAYFKSVGVTAGIYSTSYQWGIIVGSSVSAGSNLNNTYSWLAGSSSASAKKDCAQPALTVGSKVSMTQYVSGKYDYNQSCI